MSADSGIEKTMRREYDGVVISTNGKSTKKFHLPSDNGTVEPRCGRNLNNKEWRQKDWSVYPPGWHDVCSDCADEMSQETGEIGWPPQWILSGEATPSNAATREWVE